MTLKFSLSLTGSILGALLLAGAAHAQIAADVEELPSVDEPSVYGEFLAGRIALHSGDTEEAARRLAAVSQAVPDNPQLRERAFTAALYAGDVQAAARLAPAANPDQPGLESLGKLTQAVDALASGQGAVAVERLSTVEFPHRTAAAVLRPWAQAAAGDWTAALTAPESEADRIADLFGALARAQLLEMRRKPAEAETIYKALLADPVAASLFLPMYGEFLERRGRRADAVALYDQGLQADPEDASLVALRERAQRRAKPPQLPSLTEGAAQAVGFAAAAMSANRQTELSMIYLRLALRLDPGLHQGWMLIGDALEKVHDEAAAREAWSRVPADSTYYAESRSKIIYSLQADDQDEAALKMAADFASERPDDLRARLTYADLLRTAGRHAEALTLLDALIAGGASDWRLYYMRAISLDRLDRWPEAEADLKQAMSLSSDEPEVLNYLGYAWIDRGLNVREGMTLVERAVAARPRSGAMQDSLAWAHFKLGDYAKAVELLETAVSLSPADPEVNDHLGDAYWMVGRRDEAGFQWRRVLTLNPPAEVKARAEKKLKEGLPPPQLRAETTPSA